MTADARPPDIRLLADDLTGALDSAAAFAGRVPVFLDVPPAGPAPGVVAVATATRDAAPDELSRQLDRVAPWFLGGGLAFKKVDSLLRGNTFAECARLASAGGCDGIVFAPAFPAQRRVTVGGRQFVLAPSGSAEPVGPPIAEAFAPLGWDAGTPGATRIVWIADASTDDDLRRIARRAGPGPSALPGRWLWCGSAGLAHALAEAFGIAATPRDRAADEAPSDTKDGTLLLGASRHPVSRAQWQRLRAARPGALHVAMGDEAAFGAACAALQGPSGLAALELAPSQNLTLPVAAALLQRQLATLVQHARVPRTLLVVGGDTLLATCRTSGATSLLALPTRRPGWGCARLVGGRWDGVVCHSRSGAFGDEDDLVEMLDRFHPLPTRTPGDRP